MDFTVMPLIVVEVTPLIYLALGLSFAGLFSKYKLFLLVAIGPIFFLLFEYASITDPHAGVPVIVVCLAGWVIFNVYVAFAGMTAHE